MFWKLVLVVVVPLVLFGRPSLLRHPLARVLLPRSWVSRLPMVTGDPARRADAPGTGGGSRLYVALLVLSAVALASWMVTRALISGG